MAGDAGAQRAAIRGQPAEKLNQLRAHGGAIALCIGAGLNRRNRPLTLVKLLLRLNVHPLEQRVGTLKRQRQRCKQHQLLRKFAACAFHAP
ncbi:MAG: hypothetical protein FJW31_12850 [Acidobacteria bacterium]|nr:hypothetical protein [Acidobacteriota bacterium]